MSSGGPGRRQPRGPIDTGPDFVKVAGSGTTPVVTRLADVTDQFVIELKSMLERLGLQVSARNITGEVGAGVAGLPIGAQFEWLGTALPDIPGAAVVWANGAAYPQADYPDAFAILGTTWNTFRGVAAPAAGEFRVPNWTGIGRVASAGVAGVSTGDSGGSASHTLTEAELPSHIHASGTLGTAPPHQHGGVLNSLTIGSSNNGTVGGGAAVITSIAQNAGNTNVATPSIAGNTDAVGSNQPFSIMPPYGVFPGVVIRLA